MSKINLAIPIPTFIESIVIYFLLRYRKKHCGYPFRKIRLIQANRRAKPICAKVDPDDYQTVSQYNWHLYESISRNYYAVRYEERRYIKMHRVIMNAPKGVIVDHKDGDGLNNTKDNLRFATYAQNSYNKKTGKNGSSRYRGVHLIKETGKYRAKISYNRIRKHLGYFETEEDAARAYDRAAKIYHGEFAILNFEDVTNPIAKSAENEPCPPHTRG